MAHGFNPITQKFKNFIKIISETYQEQIFTRVGSTLLCSLLFLFLGTKNTAFSTNFTMLSAYCSLARQPCPAALPGSLARQPCPAALPGSLARQPCQTALPRSLIYAFKCSPALY
jgi:hypothetical protein